MYRLTGEAASPLQSINTFGTESQSGSDSGTEPFSLCVKFLLFAQRQRCVFRRSMAHAVTQSSVSIGWTASSSPDVAAYMIYYGTSSGNYISAARVSNVTNITINGLTTGTTYYFAATSIDSSGNQSAFSSEISAVAGASGSVVITAQPASQSTAVGQSATFTVAASGNFTGPTSGTKMAQRSPEPPARF